MKRTENKKAYGSKSLTETFPLASVIVGTRDRYQSLLRCLNSILSQNYSGLEVLVLDDCSQKYHICDEVTRHIDDPRVKCFRSDQQLGVAAGRNFLMQKAQGEIILVIDDDAYFESEDTLSNVMKIFEDKPDVVILACKVKNHGATERPYNVPFSQRVLKRFPSTINESRYVGYFLGGAHAIRRKVIEECGSYDPELFFGEEELDLSYRAISRGWRIYYEPEILVHHVPQQSVVGKRNRKDEELYHHVKNRFYLAFRYLPARYIPLYLGIWLTKYLLDAIHGKAIDKYIGGIVAGIYWLRRIRRDPLNTEAIRYLQHNFGRLWY